MNDKLQFGEPNDPYCVDTRNYKTMCSCNKCKLIRRMNATITRKC